MLTLWSKNTFFAAWSFEVEDDEVNDKMCEEVLVSENSFIGFDSKFLDTRRVFGNL